MLSQQSASGWMDIVCLACMVVLSSALDRRGYLSCIPQDEVVQRKQVCSMYWRWRQWFSKKYVGKRGTEIVDWEGDVFSVRFIKLGRVSVHFITQPMLLHLARVLLEYHERESASDVNNESHALIRFGNGDVRAKVVEALESYSTGLGSKLEDFMPEHSGFWLFSGDEFVTTASF